MAYLQWKLQMQLQRRGLLDLFEFGNVDVAEKHLQWVFFVLLIISLEFCIFFKFIILIGNSYDHPWHADVRVVNQYLMTNKQTLRRRETVVEHDSTVLTHKHKAERKFPHFFTKDGLRPSEDSLRSIRGILSNIDIKWRILMQP